jgi:DNA-binding winged helix-turn-helix (wHTH) protein
LRNRPPLLTRERLLDEVWSTRIAVTDRVIDNDIVSLRKKIEDEPTASRYLISVWGGGCRFDGKMGKCQAILTEFLQTTHRTTIRRTYDSIILGLSKLGGGK